MSYNFKRCPFCGSDDISLTETTEFGCRHYCLECKAEGPRAAFGVSTLEQACDLWNKRAAVEEPKIKDKPQYRSGIEFEIADALLRSDMQHWFKREIISAKEEVSEWPEWKRDMYHKLIEGVEK